VDQIKNNLLRLPAITSLQLLMKVDSLQPGKVQQSFPKLFQGLGTLKGDYQIQMLSPMLLTLPIPLWVKVKQELECMKG